MNTLIEVCSNGKRNAKFLKQLGQYHIIRELKEQINILGASPTNPKLVYDIFPYSSAGKARYCAVFVYISPDGPGIEIATSTSHEALEEAAKGIAYQIELPIELLLTKKQLQQADYEQGIDRTNLGNN